MILYDKSGLFLGMGNQELYLLGYEDMDEFRNYHNDFADLLINKPGFIFKFKNFSWIDYAQHSGTPNKRVLIRAKNGKEIETSLIIHEIYLQKEINGSFLLYSIELTNAPFNNELPLDLNTVEPSALEEAPSGLLPFEESYMESTPPPLEPSINFDTLPSTPNTFQENDFTTPLFTSEPEKDEQEEESPSSLTFSEPLIQDDYEFKLKVDHSILEEPTNEVMKDKIKPEQYESIDEIKIDDFDFVAPIESYTDDQEEDLQKDTNLFVEELREPSSSEMEKEFDLSECAEALGLDISTLAHILEEYIASLDTAMPLLTEAIHANNRTNAKEEITKLKSVALHLQILSLFQQFEHLETSLEFDTKDEILQTLEILQKTVRHFKEHIA